MSRVAAPFWLHAYLPFIPAIGVVGLVILIAQEEEQTTSEWGMGALFLVGWIVVVAIGRSFYLKPFAEAGPQGLRGRGLGTEQQVEWNEISEVVWAHRFGIGLYTRTELLIVRAESHDREPHPFCVLHFLKGIWLGQRCSRSASEPFLEVCRRYGSSTTSAWAGTVEPGNQGG